LLKKASAGQKRAEQKLRDHQPEQVHRADGLRVPGDEEAEDDVGERASAADESEEALRLPGVEDVVGHGPELDHDQRAHHLDEDVERRVDPVGAADLEQRPEARAQRRAGERAGGVERPARHLVGEARVDVGDGDDGDGREDVHAGEALRRAPVLHLVGEIEGVAQGAAHHHGADGVRRVSGHQCHAALLPRPDAQSGFERPCEPGGHLLREYTAGRGRRQRPEA
jgi:hypothetical protein